MSTNVTLTYAEDMSDWSLRVCARGACTYPGCSSKFGLGGHHIIRRAVLALRLLIENGVCLCTLHHGQVEEIKGREQYDRTMIILVGKRRYTTLVNLEKVESAKLTAVPKITMPTSELAL